MAEVDHISQEILDASFEKPLKQLRRLKKTFVDSPLLGESPLNEENSPIYSNRNDQDQQENPKDVINVEEIPEEINKEPKKKKRQPPKEKKEKKTILKERKNDSKRFISIFSDSNEEVENKSDCQNDATSPKESTKEKTKMPKKKTQKKVDFVVEIDDGDPSTQEPVEKGNENEETEKKNEKKLKLIRLKKSKEQEGDTIQENNQEEEGLNDKEGQLKSLKKRTKKPKSSITTLENNEGNEENLEDSSKKPKKARKKKIENEEDAEYNEEGVEKPPKKSKKQEKTKPKGESTQEIFERMRQDPTFLCDEEDDEPSGVNHHDDMHFGTLKEQAKKRQAANKNHMIIKTRNKFFKEINTLEFNPLMEENVNPAEEEDYEPTENYKLLFEVTKKPKVKIDVNSFLDKFQKFKEERALNVNPQPAKSSSVELIKNPAEETSQHEPNPNEEEPKENVLPRQGDLMLAENEINQNSMKNDTRNQNSNLLESTENNTKKITNNPKHNPHDISRLLNNTLSNFSLNENSHLSLEISIPNLTKMNSNNITDTTLFVNRLARSNSFLNKSILSVGGLTHGGSQSNLVPGNNSHLTDRDLYKNKLLEEIRKRKSRNLNLKDLQDRFKSTDWTELALERQKNQEKKEQEKNKEEDESEDSDYNPIENEKNQEEKKDDLDFKKMIELEEGIQENENEEAEEEDEEFNEKNEDKMELEENKTNENQTEKDVMAEKNNAQDKAAKEDQKEETNPQLQNNNNYKDNDDNKHAENSEGLDLERNKPTENATSNNVHNLPNFNQPIMEEDENTFDIDGKDTHTLKKLRKLAETAVINYEEQRAQMKAEKKARQEAQMNDPRTKAMLRNMFEMEAELGSDNEENDDVVKRINRNEDGERDSDEDMDGDLKELIDNLTTDKDGDNELVWDKFQEDLWKQDKENLKKVLERAFNIKKKRSSGIDMADPERMDKRMTMIEERIKLLEENENLYKYEQENNENQKKEIKEDLFNEREDNFIKLREINMRIRKEVEKKTMKMDESLLVDQDIMNLIEKQTRINSNSMNVENGKLSKNTCTQQKEEQKKQETNFLTNNKFRNSVLQIKMNKANNISVFNNAYNKDIMNEFGNKFSAPDENKNEGGLAILSSELQKNIASSVLGQKLNSHSNNLNKINNNSNNQNKLVNGGGNNQNSSNVTTTSLNKFFSKRNIELNRPSPNKVFFFGLKK